MNMSFIKKSFRRNITSFTMNKESMLVIVDYHCVTEYLTMLERSYFLNLHQFFEIVVLSQY